MNEDDELSRNNNNGKIRINMDKEQRKGLKKLIYVLIIVLIALNLIFVWYGDGHYVPANNNRNIINNNEPFSPPKVVVNEEKKEQNNIEDNIQDNKKDNDKNIIIEKNKENESNKAKMRYVEKSTRTFFKKFEMFSLFGFFGVLYFVMWNNSNKLEEDSENKNEQEKQDDKNKYQLLKENEDDYYEHI